MIGTVNFTLASDPKLACTCGHDNCDRRTIKQSTIISLQAVRDIVGHGLVVTSGGRCPNHPNEIHRTQPADHQKGNGVDVAANGGNRGNIVDAGITAGFNAIGVAKTFVHLGYRPESPAGHLTMWVY
tara:strand:+ start:94 stop:474 length:381 start_codon:yes stop_codon:yes gene_type:complete